MNAIALVAIGLATALGLVLIGLPARMLPPGGWDELRSGFDLGFAGVGEGQEYPYVGSNEWSRLIILLGAPAITGLAAALTFLPVRRSGDSARLAGLAALICAYGFAVAVFLPGDVVLRGVVLLAGVFAWLWLPTIERRTLLRAAPMLALALVAAVAFTVRFSDSDSLVDYSSWTWAAGPGTSFEWEHTYGPIDWDRSDRSMMLVSSDEPNYWKVSVLDRFNGRGWERSDLVVPPIELPSATERGAGADLVPKWQTTASVTIDGLSGFELPGPGSARRVVDGLEASPSADGTILRGPETLHKGDAYEIAGYAPDPSEAQMRAAGWWVPPRLTPMTALDVVSVVGGPIETVETRGIREGGAEEAAAAIAASPYARMADLAERLTAGAPTAYDAVKAIESHLLDNYSYSETPPERVVPLESFLFEDRVGYCQQFSGAMALMLRMRGIPARIATGFSPGVHEGGDRYRVRALDAHSWVEVYFSAIGWVPFDPTPAAAPAELRNGGSSAASSAASSLGPLLFGARGFIGDGDGDIARGGQKATTSSSPSIGAADSSSISRPLIVLVALLLATGAVALGPGLWRRARERRLGTPAAVESRVRELDLALRRLRRGHEPDATLLDLEQALRSHAEPLASRYVERLRRLRYSHDPGVAPPSGRERRALRRRLTGRGGVRRQIAAYRAIPPLSPRR